MPILSEFKLKDISIGFGIILLPIVFFYIIEIILGVMLNPIIYPVSSIAAFCICLTTLFEKIRKMKDVNKLSKIFYFILFMFVLPIASIYGFAYSTPVPFTLANAGEGLFGWVFGVCASYGFNYFLPQKYRD